METDSKNETPKTREEILKMSLEARYQEIMMYQINIDNYTLALEHINMLSAEEREELQKFSSQLTNLLASEKHEQKKAKIMHKVISVQLGE